MGVAVAAQPWSGDYSIGKNAWVMAQTTQFTAPGWRYLDSSLRLPRRQPGQRQLRDPALPEHRRLQRRHRDDGRDRPADLHRVGHRRAVHRHRARLVDQRDRPTPPTTSCTTERRHPVGRDLHRHAATRLGLHADAPPPGRATAPRPSRPPARSPLPYSDNYDGYAVGRRGQVPRRHAGRVRGQRVRRRAHRALRTADVAARADHLGHPAATRTRCSATSAGRTTRSPPTSCWSRPGTPRSSGGPRGSTPSARPAWTRTTCGSATPARGRCSATTSTTR